MEIHPIPALKDNYIWTLVLKDRSVVIVDPGEAEPVLTSLSRENLSLRAIWITHHHWDHTDGISEIVRQFNVPVYGPANESIPHLTHPVRENDNVHIEGFPRMHVLSIPGHTKDHVAYHGDDILFCGDTLFAAGCGRVFEGTPEMMYRSLQKLASLPDQTRVYAAHEYTLNNLRFAGIVEPDNAAISERIKQIKILIEKYHCSLPSTLRDEKATNPFLRCKIPAVVKQANERANKPLANEVEVFATIREWKNEF